MVDTQSFPFECLAYPKLWQGAYSKREVSPITSIRRPLALLLLFNPCIYTTLTSSKSADLPTHISSSPPLLLSSPPLFCFSLSALPSVRDLSCGGVWSTSRSESHCGVRHAWSRCQLVRGLSSRGLWSCLLSSILVYSCLVLSCLALCRLSTLHTSVMIHSQSNPVSFPYFFHPLSFLSFSPGA